MKSFTTLQIGQFHTLHCEDNWLIAPLNEHSHLIAVMDGCTMGDESVFAALLIKKLLRKSAKANYYQNWLSPKPRANSDVLRDVFRSLHAELRKLQNQLELETNELLSTLILGIVDLRQRNADFLTIGDGVLVANGAITEYDQGDKPDYLAYHLSEDFDSYFAAIKQKIHFENLSDLSVATDGILSFRNLQHPDQQRSAEEVIAFLTKDAEELAYSNGLDRKIDTLATEWKHFPTDDLALIRILIEQ